MLPDEATARVAGFLESVVPAAEGLWRSTGGAVAERHLGAEAAGRYRDAFVHAHQAAALDAEVAAVTASLRSCGKEEAPQQPQPRKQRKEVEDDVSDLSNVQQQLVARRVQKDKPERPFVPGHSDLGGGRHVITDFADDQTCGRLVASAAVALGRGFRRRGQSSVGVFPCLAERLSAIPPAADGRPPIADLYLTVERMRRCVAECFGAEVADVRISDAQIARLQPFDPESPPADGWDVGAIRDDRFCYWRPHIDQVSVTNFEWSCLLYLASHGEDFEGGRFVMHDDDDDWVLLPKRGTLVTFPSGAESVHSVERVTKGLRFAVTAWFTRRPDAYDGAPPEHLEMLEWARAAVDGEQRPAPACAAPRQQLFRQAETALTSAAVCTLPANDALLQAVVAARSDGAPGDVARCIRDCAGDTFEKCPWHEQSLLAETGPSADPERIPALLKNRVPAAASLLRQLHPSLSAPKTAAADDAFGGVFD